MGDTAYRIPLEPVAQRFAVDLSGIPLILVTKWNGELPAWELSILDGTTEVPLVTALALVSGVDLLEQHAHLGIPGQLWVDTEGAPDDFPTEDNLGTISNLYYIPT